jgi:beta-lysine 5,6-aminomutase alpha subunit
MAKLRLNQQKVAACRKYAKKIADDLQKVISLSTTVSVERAVLRLFGIDKVSRVKVPYPNLVVDAVRQEGLLRHGVSNIIAYMMVQYNKDLKSVTRAIAQKKIKPSFDEDFSGRKLRPVMKKLCTAGVARIEKSKREREKLQKKFPTGPMPWLYVIVATGNIYEDIKQAR